MKTIRFLLHLSFTLFFLASCEETKKKANAQYPTIFEQSAAQETATYGEVITFYTNLAKDFPEINIQKIGETDSGHPLHIVTFNRDGDFNFQKIDNKKTVILINNGIHPGEPDGIDATMLLFRNLATDSIVQPENVVISTIPVYNVGGMLNRNSTTRVNQNGPKAYGFRGNAQNYDLNRDFIKADTKNAKTFASIFHLVKPDLFIDTHVSNGADYQYSLTHLFTQHNKLGGKLGQYLEYQIKPFLESDLAKKNWEITPYVNVFNKPPELGFAQFFDNPRYSTGYTTLWNSLGMMVETHMLKAYGDRVAGTYELLVSMINFADSEDSKIRQLREDYFETLFKQDYYPITWQLDSTKTSTLSFKGYEVDTLVSQVTGVDRLKYNKSKPFEKDVVYYNHYKAVDSVEVPHAYLLKKGWQKIIDRLEMNDIQFQEFEKDTILKVDTYFIADYETYRNPYEGHYPHYNTKVNNETVPIQFEVDDLIIPTQQPGIRYLLETLEPEAVDSFFNWNFFDTILQQKEGYSPYVFEDLALQILEANNALKDTFMLKKERDTVFAANGNAQLYWIFKNSKYYEKAHLQYPVYRILKNSPNKAIVSEN